MADRKDFEGLAVPHLSAVYRAALVFCGQVPAQQFGRPVVVFPDVQVNRSPIP